MANIKISELDELQKATDQDLLVIVDVDNNRTKKIQAGNLGILVPKTTKTTSDTETYSCNYVNSLKPSAITVGLTNDTDFTTSSLIVPLDKVVGSTGSKFELINNKIKIGTGVTKIKVSGSLTEQSNIAGLFGGYISKNGTTLNDAINVGFSTLATANEMYKITCTPIIVNVTPGDLIMLNAYTQKSSATVTIKAYNGRATNITIEEVIE